MDRLAQILFAKLVIDALFLPSARFLTLRPLQLRDAHGLLTYLWQVTCMLGPFLPELLPMSVVLAQVHIALLYGGLLIAGKSDAREDPKMYPTPSPFDKFVG
eukprot:6381839-Amphidinium_carterae.1